jgi:hypothetical protein
MKRGELYRIFSASPIDTKKQRVYVVVSRQELSLMTYSMIALSLMSVGWEAQYQSHLTRASMVFIHFLFLL